ncbi:MAG TPA: PilZ domain-containing protein [Polyangiales bacterium]|nr:PilZ domain-containing protein [Polyangiales bacterium]
MDGSGALVESQHRRRSLRRSVRLETEVMSEYWDGSVPLLTTDLSPHGSWIEADYPLPAGSELLISFIPPRWSHSAPFQARAQVVRVGLLRRRNDRGSAGMGLYFKDLRDDQIERLSRALHGVPPPLPSREIELELPRLPAEACLRLDDGSRQWLCAEAPLLTGGRPRLPPTAAMTRILRVQAWASVSSASSCR